MLIRFSSATQLTSFNRNPKTSSASIPLKRTPLPATGDQFIPTQKTQPKFGEIYELYQDQKAFPLSPHNPNRYNTDSTLVVRDKFPGSDVWYGFTDSDLNRLKNARKDVSEAQTALTLATQRFNAIEDDAIQHAKKLHD